MNCLTKLFQQKRRRIGYILAFSDQMISKRDSSDFYDIIFLSIERNHAKPQFLLLRVTATISEAIIETGIIPSFIPPTHTPFFSLIYRTALNNAPIICPKTRSCSVGTECLACKVGEGSSTSKGIDNSTASPTKPNGNLFFT